MLSNMLVPFPLSDLSVLSGHTPDKSDKTDTRSGTSLWEGWIC